MIEKEIYSIAHSYSEETLNFIINSPYQEKIIKNHALTQLRRIGGKRKCEFDMQKFVKGIELRKYEHNGHSYRNYAEYESEFADGSEHDHPDKPILVLGTHISHLGEKMEKFIEDNITYVYNDEYTTCTSCYKLIHIYGDYYGQAENFISIDGEGIFCKNCVLENSDMTDMYLNQIKNTNTDCYEGIKLEHFGYRRIQEYAMRKMLLNLFKPREFEWIKYRVELEDIIEFLNEWHIDVVFKHSGICDLVSNYEIINGIFVKRSED